MQTTFTEQQLQDPGIQRANEILRSCVHCGFCTATCPTYQVLGDELDSPRGRIYQIKDMLENERDPDPKTVLHIDRCLSCLACMTTCPSGVHYMHLVDHAREYIEGKYKRPFMDRMLRWTLARILPYPTRFRLALLGAKIGRPFAFLMPDARLKAMLEMAPKHIPPVSRNDDPQSFAPEVPRKKRVALMTGCAQKALNTDINDATIRLLTRLGVEVVVPAEAGCCGSLTHHMGKEEAAHASVKANVDAWIKEADGEGLDAIVINASGCGTTVKDYGFMLREDKAYAEKAARVAGLTKDVTEFVESLGPLPKQAETGLDVAYHSACSMQHGQKIKTLPQKLLAEAGFTIKQVPEGHLCCGSAGTYNMLQPKLADQLKERKIRNIESTKPELVATGNIGCMTQIGSGTGLPVVHTVQLLDWATGGPKPAALN